MDLQVYFLLHSLCDINIINYCIFFKRYIGAIVWFDAGHSDSMDPSTYKGSMLGNNISSRDGNTAWSYIRVPGLELFPGLVCPHADRIQSNGILRVDDFDDMLLR